MPNERLEQLIARMQANRQPDATLAERRAQGDRTVLRLAEDVTATPISAGGVPAEWVATPNAGGTVVLYLHGGGYTSGSIVSHRELASRIARAAAARVLLLGYRLAPEHPFPAAVDDALAAYDWLLAQGSAPSEIAIAGDSAGGGLAAATLLALRDAGKPLPAAGVLLSPWTDLTLSGESIASRADRDPMVATGSLQEMVDAYLAGADPRHSLASPLLADLTGLPPLLVQVGGREILYDDATRLVERAQAAGVQATLDEDPEMIHVFQALAALLPEGQAAIDRIGRFIQERVAAVSV